MATSDTTGVNVNRAATRKRDNDDGVDEAADDGYDQPTFLTSTMIPIPPVYMVPSPNHGLGTMFVGGVDTHVFGSAFDYDPVVRPR